MKRPIFLTVTLVLCITISAQDFRNVSWGDSKVAVEASESGVEWGEYSDNMYEVLGFETSIVGLETYVVFIFVDNKLVRTKYFFNETHFNKNLYISEFDRVDELLQTKYGEGDKEEIWKNTAFKHDESDHGDAIGYGHYEIYVRWEIQGKTTISHSLTAGDINIEHEVQYSSIELEEFVEEAEMEVF
jgi:hypothetical protein